MGLNRNINDDSTLAYLFNKTRQGASDALSKAVEAINNTITTITTNMPQWINANIGYVAGESTENILTRLVSGAWLPREKVFIGRVLSGSYYFVAGHLYEAGGKLYGSVVFNGIGATNGGVYAIYEGVVYRQNVHLAGDTMIGNLSIAKNDPRLTLKSSVMDTSANPPSGASSVTVSHYDKNDAYASYWQTTENADGTVVTSLAARRIVNNQNYTNAISLSVTPNADLNVSVSSATNWRTAIGAVYKGGDTMTGPLYLSVAGNPVLYGDNTTADITKATDTDTRYWLWAHRDGGGRISAYWQTYMTTGGTDVSDFRVRKYTSANDYTDCGLSLRVDKNGTKSVLLTDSAAWLAALGLGTSGAFPITIAQGGTGQSAVSATSAITSIATPASGVTIASAYYAQWGKVAYVKLTLSKNVAMSGTTVVATMVSGKRTIYQIGLTPYTRSDICAYMDANGEIRVSGNIAANNSVYLSGTYILP